MKNTIQVNKSANFVTHGNPNTAKIIVFALHGYGQLAEFFVRKFNVLNETDYFIVAPEGLHRFYLKGASGRVGASWMTKQERQSDINDYINYLDDVWLKINSEYNFEKKYYLVFHKVVQPLQDGII